MNEQEKLREAKYFFERMKSALEEPEAFRYELSAFLSAARSVLQYAREEAIIRNKLQWYEDQVSKNSVLVFFREKRNLNIHKEPVKPSRRVSLSLTEHIHVSDSIIIKIQKEDGTTETRGHKEKPAPSALDEGCTDKIIRYVFEDWPGTEDVLALSHQYLKSLESFVQKFSNELSRSG